MKSKKAQKKTKKKHFGWFFFRWVFLGVFGVFFLVGISAANPATQRIHVLEFSNTICAIQNFVVTHWFTPYLYFVHFQIDQLYKERLRQAPLQSAFFTLPLFLPSFLPSKAILHFRYYTDVLVYSRFILILINPLSKYTAPLDDSSFFCNK